MARKGNRQRNGLDRNIPNQKHAVSESIDASLSDDKHEKSTACDKKRVDAELSSGDPKCSSTSPSGERLSNSKHMGSGKRKQQFQNIPSRGTSKNTTSNILESVDMSSQVRDDVGNDFSGASKSRIDDEVLYGSNNNFRDTTSSMPEDVSVKNIMENIMAGCLSLLAVVCRNLRVSVLPTLKVAEGWLEQQKPRFKAFMSALSYAHSCIRVKVDYAYPIIRTWVCYFGQLLFALTMVWMDCNIRGLDSLLRLGTTSFLTVVWCSILSITAMIGIAKMLMILVVAALMVVFIGFALAIFIVTILAVVILWMYGSFWATGFVIFLGGITLALRYERVALLVTVLYSMHCARSYIGWLGLLFGLNLAFISSDVLAHMLKNIDEYRSNVHPEESHAREGHFSGEPLHSSPVNNDSQPAYGISADRNSGVPSTSGATAELTPEDEIIQLLNCNDHYSALGLKRYEDIDVSSIKREYRKKAMLVHPDKNMGNEKAVEAFKKLQNAYEVLLDSLKRKTYDDELRREEILDYIRRFQSAAQKNGKHGTFSSTFNHFRDQDESSRGESRRIACKKCNDFHIWIRVERSKSQARWCQDCKDFHQAKDGDGWVEQSCQPLLFGLLQKMDPPSVYVCAESRIYDATEWFICQGMRCPPNTHKPSFHVNANIAKGTNSTTRRGGGGGVTADMDETMTEEEFFEWLQNAVQSGMFEASSAANESPSPRTGSTSKSSTKKRKGKKQW